MNDFKNIFTLYACIVLIFIFIFQSILLKSISDINPYLKEINFISSKYNENMVEFEKNILGYIDRVGKIESGLKNIHMPYVMCEYYDLKKKNISTFKKFLYSINSGDEDVNEYIFKYNENNKICDQKIKKIFKMHGIK